MTKIKNSRTALATVLAISVVVLTACGNDAGEPEAPPPPASSDPTAQESVPKEAQDDQPGAMVGNTQRSWPDPDGMIDDTAHATPGSWSVDWAHQRPVWTPVNHDGDLPEDSSLVAGGFEHCQDQEVTLLGETQQQYVNGRYLVVNDQAGPSRLNDGVPAGFAHSPQGAITLALNMLGYGIAAQGDGVGEEIDAQWWSTFDTVQNDREFQGLDNPDFDHTSRRADLIPAAGYYKVVHCSPNVVVIEIGHDFTLAGGEAVKTTVSLFWEDNDWKPDFTGQAGTTFDQGGTFDPEDSDDLNAVFYQ